jgi:hypothetical protein
MPLKSALHCLSPTRAINGQKEKNTASVFCVVIPSSAVAGVGGVIGVVGVVGGTGVNQTRETNGKQI